MNSRSEKTHTRFELTLRAILLGLLLSVVMGAANVYMGLKAGMTVSASIPAAVLAMLFFRFFFKDGSVLEANQVQTAASAGESLAAGVIFTMPALVMVGFWSSFDFWTVALVSFSGGILGILFMIPVRRVFVVDNKDLPYPEGVACAAVLTANRKDNNASRSDAKPLFLGAVLGACYKLLEGVIGVVAHTLQGAALSFGRVFYLGTYVSPMLVAVGAIVGLNVAVLIFAGGAFSWLICMPFIDPAPEPSLSPVDRAWDIWSNQVRYIGVGAMVVGGITSIFEVRKGLVQAITVLIKQLRSRVKGVDRDRDMPPFMILSLFALATLIAGLIIYRFTDGFAITTAVFVLVLILGFFFTAVASYIVGLVGNSNSPVSGMTITAVLFSGAVLYLLRFSGVQSLVAILAVASFVCCIACTSGDICNDLKTGHLVGASPFRQQAMQVLAVAVSCLVMAPVLQLLHRTTESGIGGADLPAPQAALFASLAKALSGKGEIPWQMVGIGVIVGTVIALIDLYLKLRQSRFRIYPMPLAVGMYLPFGLGPPILLGGLLAHFLTRSDASKTENSKPRSGILFSSGVIAGESLLGIGIACLIGLGFRRPELELSSTVQLIITLVFIAVTLWAFVRVGLKRSS